jgi:hypothetical protein
MSIHSNRPNRLIGASIGAIVAAAFFVPAAGAQPIDVAAFGAAPSAGATPDATLPLAVERTASGANPVAQSTPVTNSPSVASPSSGFDWGDAAIGAGVTAGVIAVGLGGALGGRRLKATAQRNRMPAATSS